MKYRIKRLLSLILIATLIMSSNGLAALGTATFATDETDSGTEIVAESTIETDEEGEDSASDEQSESLNEQEVLNNDAENPDGEVSEGKEDEDVSLEVADGEDASSQKTNEDGTPTDNVGEKSPEEVAEGFPEIVGAVSLENVVANNLMTGEDGEATEGGFDLEGSVDPEEPGEHYDKEAGKYYYIDEDGNRVIDSIIKVDGDWYYFDEDGFLVIGQWFNDGDGYRHYANGEGQLAVGETEIDGKTYQFDEKGYYLCVITFYDGETQLEPLDGLVIRYGDTIGDKAPVPEEKAGSVFLGWRDEGDNPIDLDTAVVNGDGSLWTYRLDGLTESDAEYTVTVTIDPDAKAAMTAGMEEDAATEFISQVESALRNTVDNKALVGADGIIDITKISRELLEDAFYSNAYIKVGFEIAITEVVVESNKVSKIVYDIKPVIKVIKSDVVKAQETGKLKDNTSYTFGIWVPGSVGNTYAQVDQGDTTIASYAEIQTDSVTNAKYVPVEVNNFSESVFTLTFPKDQVKITWKWLNEACEMTSESEEVPYNTTPIHAVPATRSNAEYIYTFDCWDPIITEETKVTEDITYTAKYIETPITEDDKIEVTFDYNYEGAKSKTETYLKGKKITESDPEREGYFFWGWYIDDAYVDISTYTVAEKVTLKAHWKSKTLTADDNAGIVITEVSETLKEQINSLADDEKKKAMQAIVNAAEANKINNETDLSKLVGKIDVDSISPKIIHQAASIDADIAVCLYVLVTGLDMDETNETEPIKLTYDIRPTIVLAKNETPLNYWEYAQLKGTTALSFNIWVPNVVAKNYGKVVQGENQIANKTIQNTTGSEKYIPVVISDLSDSTFILTFEETTTTYTVTWENYDGTLLDTEQYEYGTEPEYKKEEPTRDATKEHVYNFSGWETSTHGPITPVTGDITYTAVFTEAAAKYTVTFNYNDGSTVTSQEYPYGSNIEVEDPIDDNDNYKFVGWYINNNWVDLSEYKVSGDVELVAYWIKKVLPADATANVTISSSVLEIINNLQISDEEKEATKNTIINEGKAINTRENGVMTNLAAVIDADLISKHLVAIPNENDKAGIQIGLDVVVVGLEMETVGEEMVPTKVTYNIKPVFKVVDENGEIIENNWEYGKLQSKATFDFNIWVPGEVAEGKFAKVENSASINEDGEIIVNSAIQKESNVKYVPVQVKNFEKSIFKLTFTAEVPESYLVLDKTKWSEMQSTDSITSITFTKNYEPSEDEEKNSWPLDINGEGYIKGFYKDGTQNKEIIVSVDGNKIKLPQSCEEMFYKYSALTELNGLDVLDTSNVTDMSYMFSNCTSLKELDLSKFDTSKVTQMRHMFDGCESLKELDLSTFDTSNVYYMGSMFADCISLEKLDISNFNTAKIDPEGLLGIGEILVHDDQLQQITIGSNVDLSLFTKPSELKIEGADDYWYDADGNRFASGAVEEGETAIYYPTYGKITYSCLGETSSEYLTYGTQYTIRDTVPSEEGRAFVEWNTKEDGSGDAYDPGDIVSSPDTIRNITLYDIWDVDTYTITWVWLDDEGKEDSDTTDVAHGEMPTHADPATRSTAEYTYTFKGWFPTLSEAVENATYTAEYTETKNTYTITFVDGDGKTLQEDVLEYGATPSYKGDTPTKTADAQFTYTFNGTWDSDIETVKGDKIYTAQFDATVNEYLITFVDGDGKTLQEDNLEYGTMPEYKGETPTKTATPQYTYVFNKTWDSEIAEVTEAKTYTAQFDSTVNKYLITFVDENGTTVLDTVEVEYGATPEYTKDDPTKESTPQYAYTFGGWSPAIEAVTGTATYTATYIETTRRYYITWLDEDGSEIEKTHVEYGKMPTHADLATRSTAEYTYTFEKWTPDRVAVTEDATYTASFTATKNKYEIIFANYDGTELQKSEVEYGVKPVYEGETPTKPSAEGKDYTFLDWDKPIAAVTEATTYTATFTDADEIFTITWVDENGNTIDTTRVPYGQMPTHADATKEPTAQYSYEFDHWNPEIVVAEADAEYKAVFKDPVLRKYTITWLNDDESLIDTTEVAYGETPTHADPTKEPTAQYTYVFDGWDPAIEAVSEEATYKATFKIEQAESYRVTFKYNNGASDRTVKYDSGSKIDEKDPEREGYIFMGWYINGTKVDLSTYVVTEEVTLEAQWEEKVLTEANADNQSTVVTSDELTEKINKLAETDKAAADAMKAIVDTALSTVFDDYDVMKKLVEATDVNKISDKLLTEAVAQNAEIKVGLEIVLKDVEMDSNGKEPTKVTYDIHPIVKVVKDGNVIDSEEGVLTGSKAFSFYIWIPSEVTKKYVKVIHKHYNTSEQIAYTTIQKDGDTKYVKVQVKNFSDFELTFTDTAPSSGGGGGSSSRGSSPSASSTYNGRTYSYNWVLGEDGRWHLYTNEGDLLKNTWVCDDVIVVNGQNVWYAIDANGNMLENVLIKDINDNYYLLEMDHNGYFGMLRYKNGTYNVQGQAVYVEFEQQHNGAFGSIINADDVEKLKREYDQQGCEFTATDRIYTKAFGK